MRTMGIDIGTTTVSMVMIDGDNGELLCSRTIPHDVFLKGPTAASRVQDPDKLWRLAAWAAGAIIKEYGRPDSIGMTGQMHGILYVDGDGEAVSPFYTWQDGNGNECMETGRTYAEVLREETGTAAAGYGLTTHFYLQNNGMIPKTARKMVTISDYIAMKLCGRSEPVIAEDMAASWGCFDLKGGDFCRDKLAKAGVKLDFLPELLHDHRMMGTTVEKHDVEIPAGIPVAVSWGDNQASVLGSVKDLSNTVLINIGTGSQVSFGTAAYLRTHGAIELRPCTDKFYLMVGAGLCGGRAYAMLEQFYSEVAGKQEKDDMYACMECQAREFIEHYGKEAAWQIRTTFSGTRSNPGELGSISGISAENFHPGAMTVGMMQGILGELYELYQEMCRMSGTKAIRLVGSGNGIRRNALMRELAEELFQMPMEIPVCQEEAAYGAALQLMPITARNIQKNNKMYVCCR